MKILKGTEKHIPAIIELAYASWPVTYKGLVDDVQINFMLAEIYQTDILTQQINDPSQHFIVLEEDHRLIGYAQLIEQVNKVKLSKLYIFPELKGKGYGNILMKAIEDEVARLGFDIIELCVNRGNPTQTFYEKQGYQTIESIDIPFGPYWMNDYLMQKKLTHA
ncbi:MAG TPA: GNAT family N-acetyltransferase [Chitinophagaceae bacterium]|nr:GNAT family N-acetyltransferase [Chitinophagaceae bacterium]